MCRVLGITNFDYTQHEQIIARFCELAKTGIVMEEDPPGHEDGWGLAFYENGALVVHKSGVNLLDETDTVFSALSRLQTSPLMIIHLRKSAWKETSNTRHAHPFYSGNTVFFHNGVVYDYQGLLPEITYPGLEEDARDTEVLFYHVMSGQADDLGQKFLDSAARVQQKHRFSALNCLFSDGATFYAYRDYAREPDYYALFKARFGDSQYISSEPLDDNLQWQPMAKKELIEIALDGLD